MQFKFRGHHGLDAFFPGAGIERTVVRSFGLVDCGDLENALIGGAKTADLAPAFAGNLLGELVRTATWCFPSAGIATPAGICP